MIGVDEEMKSKARKRMGEIAEAAAPIVQAAAVTAQPVVLVLGERFRAASEQARRLVDMFAVLRPARRPPARKPCAWCSRSRKRPALFVVKWHEPVVWADEFQGPEEHPMVTPAGAKQLMCRFHAERASRYQGVKVYRFRRMP